jgi:hypothetical protein
VTVTDRRESPIEVHMGLPVTSMGFLHACVHPHRARKEEGGREKEEETTDRKGSFQGF